jgi:glutathione synthase
VIGDYLTEINVTSPTCAREIDAHCHQLGIEHTEIGAQLMDCIALKLQQRI